MRILPAMTVLAALALPLAAHAKDLTPIESVKVETDVTAISNPAAARFWGSVSEDLTAAILSRVQPRIADKGLRIYVDINEVSLANSFQTAMGTQDSILVGQVNISSDDNAKFDAYELTVSMEMANRYLPEGTVAMTSLTDTPEHYRGMINAFAENVVERLK